MYIAAENIHPKQRHYYDFSTFYPFSVIDSLVQRLVWARVQRQEWRSESKGIYWQTDWRSRREIKGLDFAQMAGVML